MGVTNKVGSKKKLGVTKKLEVRKWVGSKKKNWKWKKKLDVKKS